MEDYFFFVGALNLDAKILVLHWINRIMNPFVELRSREAYDMFMDVEDEHVEMTEFFNKTDFYPTLGELYSSIPTKSRAVAIIETKESLAKLLHIARYSVHRHDFRIGFIRDKEVTLSFVGELDPMRDFITTEIGRECWLVKNRNNNTLTQGMHGRLLDEHDFIHKNSLMVIDVLDEHSALIINTIRLPMYL